VAVYTLDDLSKKQAQQLSKNLHPLKGLPWKIDLLVESTIHHRASLHPENAKTFRDLSRERESSEQFVWYVETETQLRRWAIMPSIQADWHQDEVI
jgi:hypothetical protein